MLLAFGWLVYELTHDPLYLGLIGLAEAIPALGLALPSGWIVDHGRPLAIYRRALACSVLSAALTGGPRVRHVTRIDINRTSAPERMSTSSSL